MLLLMATILPDSAVISEMGKIAVMIFISSHGLSGEDDFRCQRLKKTMLLVGKAGSQQAEKSRAAAGGLPQPCLDLHTGIEAIRT